MGDNRTQRSSEIRDEPSKEEIRRDLASIYQYVLECGQKRREREAEEKSA